MTSVRKRILIAVVLAVLGGGTWFWLQRRDQARLQTEITANGTIETDEVEIGAQRSARLAEYRVEEGVRVKLGQVVAVLDTSELKAQVQQAEGTSRKASARLAELMRGARPEELERAAGQVVQARAGLSGAERALANSRKGFQRRTALKQALDQAETQLRVARASLRQAETNRVGSENTTRLAQREYETSLQLRSARDTATQAVETAEAGVRVANARLAELENGARPEELRAAEAAVRQAEANTDAAREELANARIDLRRVRTLVEQRAEARQRLDQAETRAQTADARVRLAQQASAAAAAQRDQLRNGARLEDVEAARATLRQAEATLAGQRKTLAAAQQAYELRLGAATSLEAARTTRGTAAAQVTAARSSLQGAELAVRNARTAYRDALAEKQSLDTATQQLQSARGGLQTAQAQLLETRNGATREQLEQARGDAQQAQAALLLARTQYEQSLIRAPRDGVLTKHVAREGEVVGPGAVVARLSPLQEVYLTLYVPLPELGRVKLGQRVDVTADTYPDKPYRGEVTWISDTPEFTPRNVQTRDERVKLVFQVKVAIENPNGELKPGMPADAVIRLGSGQGTGGRGQGTGSRGQGSGSGTRSQQFSLRSGGASPTHSSLLSTHFSPAEPSA